AVPHTAWQTGWSGVERRRSRAAPDSAPALPASPASSREPRRVSDPSLAQLAAEEMGREEPVDDGAVRGASGVVAVTIIGIQDLVLGADPVEQRMAGLRWAYIVLQSDVHDDRAGDPVGEVDPVEVGDGFLDFRSALGVAPQVVVDLLVGIRVLQLDGIDEAAEVR